MKYTIYLAFLILFGIFDTSFSAPIIEENDEIAEETLEKASQQLEEGIATSEWKKTCLTKLEDIKGQMKEGSETLKKLSDMMADFLSDFREKLGLIGDQVKKTMLDAKEKLNEIFVKS